MCEVCLLVPCDGVALVPFAAATPVSVLYVQIRLEEWEMGVHSAARQLIDMVLRVFS